MTHTDPVTTLEPTYSASDASATPWTVGLTALENAEVYWLTTVRPDGRPHVTPLIAVWLDDALHFCTGAHERKAINLDGNPHCALTTGCNSLTEGLDLVVEGEAVKVSDEHRLQRVAERYRTKYGSDWSFTVRDGGLVGEGGNVARVYAVAPVTAFGFGKQPYSQTRWKFQAAPH